MSKSNCRAKNESPGLYINPLFSLRKIVFQTLTDLVPAKIGCLRPPVVLFGHSFVYAVKALSRRGFHRAERPS